MSEQQWFDEIGAEKLAKSYSVIASMIFHACPEKSIRDAADLLGIGQEEVDALWTKVIGGDEDPVDQFNRSNYLEQA